MPSANILAFDFGENRIGVAVGDINIKICHPLEIITGHNKFEKLDKIAQLIDLWQPIRLLVGLPNTHIQQTITNITKFANRLKERFHLEVVFIDEDYTSLMAEDMLKEQNIFGIKQKHKLDSLAASLILKIYFDRM